MPTRIDAYSLAAIPVEQFFRDTPLGQATAFVWERYGKTYLITNWHVVTCRNSETGACIAAHAAEPDRLRVILHSLSKGTDTSSIEIPLRDEDGRPLWLWHAVHGRRVDVVALPVHLPEGWGIPINKLSKEALSVQIGMDVFVLGYPFGAPTPSLPVWKRGSIASEPQLVRLADLFHLVDTASRPGMSGAPVVLRSYGARLTESGTSIKTEPGTRFFGVYSGRLKTNDAEDAQLGRVWPESLIAEIIDGATSDPGNWP
jgi:hypothetical protein